jgi:uncharacterized protein (TIGR03085 family)
MTNYAQLERASLAELFDRVGPGQPTLCEGWTTADLAAHLVVRERRPDAAVGVVVPPLAAYTDKVQRQVRDGASWTDLVGKVRNGPPLLLHLLDEPVNTLEYFVHHEDVRRAQPDWEPRSLEAGEDDALWKRLRPMSRLALRKVKDRVVLSAPGQQDISAGRGPATVTVTGPPGEIVLFVFGRADAARVTLSGDPDAVERLRASGLGI